MEDQTQYLITLQFILMIGEFICCIMLAAIALYAIQQQHKAEDRLREQQPVPDKMPGDTLSDLDRLELEQFVREL